MRLGARGVLHQGTPESAPMVGDVDVHHLVMVAMDSFLHCQAVILPFVIHE